MMPLYKKTVNKRIEKLSRIDAFTNSCAGLVSEMRVEYKAVAPSFEFSNTGRRGLKYFSVTVLQLKTTLEDMLSNFEHFEGNSVYGESRWRELFSQYISDDVVNALSTVQTLPMFSLINKVLTIANSIDSYTDKTMPLSETNLQHAITYLDSQLPNNDDYLNSLENDTVVEVSPAKITGAKNCIFYGAPGTGKSYSISQEVSEAHSIRTVFHPDTQYSDFVGCLKPFMQGNGSIGYGFRPGPFTEAVIKATNHPDQMYSLVIEEINRAAAAAVFGEVFQLLDRNATGSSTYPINISDPDMLEYLNSKTNNAFTEGKLILPSNLSLLATMNSSDQAVMPLDTAFKRRWEFKYLPIDYSKASDGALRIPVSSGEVILVKWGDFARVINDQLATQRIPEDRLLGHRFISDIELSGNVDDVLKGKLFMYLWDDVLRHGRHGIIFKDTLDSTPLANFGQLAQAFQDRKAVFNEEVESELNHYKIVDSPAEVVSVDV